jgi:hypothetical protein
MVTPYKNDHAGPKDDFNFFHSQLCINIERAFGMLVKKWAVLQKPLPCRMGPSKHIALTMALCQLNNFSFGDDAGQPEHSNSGAPANSDYLSRTTGAANATATVDTGDNVSQLIDGGQHFQYITDEELAAEQSSRIRLQMRKLVEASGLHHSVISIQNRNNNN